MIKKYNKSIYEFLVCCGLLLSPLSITVFENVSTVFYIFFFLISIPYVIKSVSLKSIDIKIIKVFYSLPFLGIIIGIVSLFRMPYEYMDFYKNVCTRLFNYIIYFVFFIVASSCLNKNLLNKEKVYKAYEMGCYILVFFGIWQLLHMYFNIPYPNFETRSQIHSMSLDSVIMKNRLTSIAREPAYLIPFLMDLFIIKYYSKQRNKILSLLIIIILLVFSLSLSGYCNFSILLIIIYSLEKKTKKKYTIGLLVFILITLFIIKFAYIFQAVFSRLQFSKLFESMRLQEMYIPMEYTWNNSAVLGFGTAGCKLIGPFQQYKSGWAAGTTMRLPTTHFYLLDYYIDYGILGIIFYVSFILILYKCNNIIIDDTEKKKSFVLLVNYIITSMYTSDYASPRATMIILLILCLTKSNYGNQNEKNIIWAI